MTQELGRISRPSADQYQGRRKLLLVPLVYGPPTADPEGAAVLQNYWEQAQTQVAALETALGQLQHVYHESLTAGGEEGLEQLEAADQRSHRLIRDKCQAGAVLEETEDLDILLETLDLQTVSDDAAGQSVCRRQTSGMVWGKQSQALRTHRWPVGRDTGRR